MTQRLRYYSISDSVFYIMQKNQMIHVFILIFTGVKNKENPAEQETVD